MKRVREMGCEAMSTVSGVRAVKPCARRASLDLKFRDAEKPLVSLSGPLVWRLTWTRLNERERLRLSPVACVGLTSPHRGWPAARPGVIGAQRPVAASAAVEVTAEC